MFTSSWIHQQFFHDDRWSWCVDREHGDPSSDAYRGERGFSSSFPNLHEVWNPNMKMLTIIKKSNKKKENTRVLRNKK